MVSSKRLWVSGMVAMVYKTSLFFTLWINIYTDFCLCSNLVFAVMCYDHDSSPSWLVKLFTWGFSRKVNGLIKWEIHFLKRTCPQKIHVWPSAPLGSPPTHSRAAAPRSLCKVEKVIQQEMKQTLHLITAPRRLWSRRQITGHAEAAVWIQATFRTI